MPPSTTRLLELFSGIGAVAAACRSLEARPTADARAGAGAEAPFAVVAALDHDEAAQAVYEAWWGRSPVRKNLATVRSRDLPEADVWWLSPPCQPHTTRGARRDLDDPRSEPLVHLLDELAKQVRAGAGPRALGLENVEGFVGSRAEALLHDRLATLGFTWNTAVIDPVEHGWPMVRRRVFVTAVRHRESTPTPVPALAAPAPAMLAPALAAPAPATPAPVSPSPAAASGATPRRVADWLDPVDGEGPTDPAHVVEAALRERFGGALHVVRASDPDAIAKCFTSAYGTSPVAAGSYLLDDRPDVSPDPLDGGPRLRRFTPTEIGRALGLPGHAWPASVSLRKRYKLVGNSVWVPAAAAVLATISRP